MSESALRQRPWCDIGIAPTANVAEIRRAYARKLKATDVEADPDAFIALREALEWALYEAAQARLDGSADQEPVAGEGVGDPAGVVLGETAHASPVSVWPTPESFAVSEAEAARVLSASERESEEDRFARLERLLFADPDAWPDEEALQAAVDEIIDHPEMDNVDRGPVVEAWLAQALAEAAPRSDAAVERVVDRFGWERIAGQWDQPWEIDLLVDRARSIRLIRALQDPAHPLHAAWLDLSGDAPELGLKRFTLRGDVRRLLKLIRERCPPAEEALNPYRVELWEGSRNDGYQSPTVPAFMRYLIFGAWALFVLSKLASCAGQVQPG